VADAVVGDDDVVVSPTKSPKAIGGVTRGTHPHPVLAEDVIVSVHKNVLYEDFYKRSIASAPHQSP